MGITEYVNFLADAPRVEAFRRAIGEVVTPDTVVLDLGTGIGTYALFAARAGARVYAVEVGPAVDVARELAAENGLAERIEFLRGRAERLQPPHRADVLIFEDFAPHLFAPETAELLEAVRRRWLTPEAVAIPRRIRVSLAPVSCPTTYAGLTPFADDTAYGLAVGRLTERALNRVHRATWPQDVLLAEPLEVARVEPLDLDGFGLDARGRWTLERDAVLHGLGLWIDLELSERTTFSNRPSGQPGGWSQAFLPLTAPQELTAGAEVQARVSTHGRARRRPEWWRWSVTAGGRTQELNTFRGLPLSRASLERARVDGRPGLGSAGRVRLAALELLDAGHTAAEIAHRLTERFPDQLPDEADAYRALARELGELGSPEDGPVDRRPPAGRRLTEIEAEA